MPILNINGRDVTVDDSFLKLSPDEQSAHVEEISKALPPTYDAEGFNKYIADKYGVKPDEVERMKNAIGSSEAVKGIPVAGAYANTLGGYLGAVSSAFGVSGGAAGNAFSERAAANTAMREEMQKAYEQAHPVASKAEQIIGGATSLGALGGTAAGARALGMTGSLGARTLAGAASGGTIGAADAASRGGNPGEAGLIGAGIGGAIPVARGIGS